MRLYVDKKYRCHYLAMLGHKPPQNMSLASISGRRDLEEWRGGGESGEGGQGEEEGRGGDEEGREGEGRGEEGGRGGEVIGEELTHTENETVTEES